LHLADVTAVPTVEKFEAPGPGLTFVAGHRK
jgi:hypothetical protein